MIKMRSWLGYKRSDSVIVNHLDWHLEVRNKRRPKIAFIEETTLHGHFDNYTRTLRTF